MHVGLNLVFLTPGASGGMETYARELIPELVKAAPHHRFTCFIGRPAAAGRGPWSEDMNSVIVPVDSAERAQWVGGEQMLLPPLARKAGIDLLHSFASTSPVWGQFRRVVTVHDLIYRTIPDAHPGLRSLGMRMLVPLAARRSDRVIADSESTAQDLRTFIGLPKERIDVVPLGIGAQRVSPASHEEVRGLVEGDERPIILSVSAKLAHKNLLRLIGGLARIPAEARPLLVLPGYRTPHEAELRARAQALGVAGDVRLLGWLSSPQLEGLYAEAACCVLPTLAEGFGLPVLEAMARGVPVACSDIPVLREVAGESALFFNPRSEEEITGAIRRLLEDRGLATRLAEGGPARAAAFSWSRAAQETLAVYERALSAP